MQEGGGGGGEGGGAGPVRGNSVTSSLLQNKKRSECYRKNTLLQLKYIINILTAHNFHIKKLARKEV